MDIRRQVGLNVQRLRKNRGWSQEDLAFACGLHRTYVSGVERGIRNPTIVILAKIAAALETSPDRLLRG
ncbi:MAG: helix-turn-helix domain-containing protein [Pirellulaceae bacterium]